MTLVMNALARPAASAESGSRPQKLVSGFDDALQGAMVELSAGTPATQHPAGPGTKSSTNQGSSGPSTGRPATESAAVPANGTKAGEIAPVAPDNTIEIDSKDAAPAGIAPVGKTAAGGVPGVSAVMGETAAVGGAAVVGAPVTGSGPAKADDDVASRSRRGAGVSDVVAESVATADAAVSAGAGAAWSGVTATEAGAAASAGKVRAKSAGKTHPHPAADTEVAAVTAATASRTEMITGADKPATSAFVASAVVVAVASTSSAASPAVSGSGSAVAATGEGSRAASTTTSRTAPAAIVATQPGGQRTQRVDGAGSSSTIGGSGAVVGDSPPAKVMVTWTARTAAVESTGPASDVPFTTFGTEDGSQVTTVARTPGKLSAAATPVGTAPDGSATPTPSAGTLTALTVPVAGTVTPVATAAVLHVQANPALPFAAQVSQPVLVLSRSPGDHTLTISVAPDNLGPVTVQAHVTATGIHVELFAPNDTGRDALRAILPDLRRDLAGSGLNSSLDLSSQNQPNGFGGRSAPDTRPVPELRGDGVPHPASQRMAERGDYATSYRTTSTIDVLA